MITMTRIESCVEVREKKLKEINPLPNNKWSIKTFITSETITDMCKQIRLFVSPICAANMVGIDEADFNKYMRMGYDRRVGKGSRRIDRYRLFYDAVILACADAEGELTKRMMNIDTAPADKQICLQWLERMKSERWSNKIEKKSEVAQDKNTLIIKYGDEAKGKKPTKPADDATISRESTDKKE